MTDWNGDGDTVLCWRIDSLKYLELIDEAAYEEVPQPAAIRADEAIEASLFTLMQEMVLDNLYDADQYPHPLRLVDTMFDECSSSPGSL